METSRYALLCLFVLVTGMFVSSSPQTAPDTSSEAEFRAWVARHGAKYSFTQQTLAAQSAEFTVQSTPVLAAADTPTCIRTVGPEGSGATYKKVKAAIASIPDGNTERCVIKIAAGKYSDKLLITKKKPFITFEGAGHEATFLEWGDTAASSGSTSKSASVAVLSDYFIATDIAFVNTAPAPEGGAVGKQAVALRIEGDQAQFYRVAFYGAQDTLYDKAGRHYFKDCYIQGSIDFIFGNGQSYYENCILHSIANPGSGSLTAQKRLKKSELSGYSFVNCKVTGNGPIYLGRAWGAYSRVVFLLTDISAPIVPEGWYDWGIAEREKTVYYGQYKCTGKGADTANRAFWSRDLSDSEAAPFLSWSFVDGDSWIGKV